MNKIPFFAADILLPKNETAPHEKYAVVACDQFTSQREYWEEADKIAGNSYSALRLVLPEIYLEGDISKKVDEINEAMDKYIKDGIFDLYENAMIYIERKLPDGAVRCGIVGAIDLLEYDFHPEKKAKIRATEGTVLERIPPRVKIRRDAKIELPHVMMLLDDAKRSVIEPLAAKKDEMQKLYDFDLMLGGGHITGYLINKENQKNIINAMSVFNEGDDPLFLAVGDGNHSLATAKACYELSPSELSRNALVEVVNIHDDALVFEPIYRILTGVDSSALCEDMKSKFSKTKKNNYNAVEFISKNIKETFYLEGFPVGLLQNYLDEYIEKNPNVKIDYIHGEDVVRKLAEIENCVGFVFDGIDKNELFNIIKKDGVLPRKAFSMGEAAGKRYYMEARFIK